MGRSLTISPERGKEKKEEMENFNNSLFAKSGGKRKEKNRGPYPTDGIKKARRRPLGKGERKRESKASPGESGRKKSRTVILINSLPQEKKKASIHIPARGKKKKEAPKKRFPGRPDRRREKRFPIGFWSGRTWGGEKVPAETRPGLEKGGSNWEGTCTTPFKR